MPQSLEFFRLMFDFADALSQRVGEPMERLAWRFTPLPKSLGISEADERWPEYLARLRESSDPAAFAHQDYVRRIGPDPQTGDATFHGHPLFGPFYYEMRAGGVVRPHVAKLQPYASSPLDADRRDVSRSQLGAMFRHIRKTEPEARTVLGNSWMYNVRAYRELYPPEFTRELPDSHDDEFQYLALWGQFVDREWRVRPDLARGLLQAVSRLEHLAELRLCFPLQVLTPSLPIEPFFAFYGVSA